MVKIYHVFFLFVEPGQLQNQYVVFVWEANAGLCFYFLFNIYIKEKLFFLKCASTVEVAPEF